MPSPAFAEIAAEIFRVRSEIATLTTRLHDLCEEVRSHVPGGTSRRVADYLVSVYRPRWICMVVDAERVPPEFRKLSPDRARILASVRETGRPVPGAVCREAPPPVVVRKLDAPEHGPQESRLPGTGEAASPEARPDPLSRDTRRRARPALAASPGRREAVRLTEAPQCRHVQRYPRPPGWQSRLARPWPGDPRACTGVATSTGQGDRTAPA